MPGNHLNRCRGKCQGKIPEAASGKQKREHGQKDVLFLKSYLAKGEKTCKIKEKQSGV
jgi:hypothetical protein